MLLLCGCTCCVRACTTGLRHGNRRAGCACCCCACCCCACCCCLCSCASSCACCLCVRLPSCRGTSSADWDPSESCSRLGLRWNCPRKGSHQSATRLSGPHLRRRRRKRRAQLLRRQLLGRLVSRMVVGNGCLQQWRLGLMQLSILSMQSANRLNSPSHCHALQMKARASSPAAAGSTRQPNGSRQRVPAAMEVQTHARDNRQGTNLNGPSP